MKKKSEKIINKAVRNPKHTKAVKKKPKKDYQLYDSSINELKWLDDNVKTSEQKKEKEEETEET
jgi:hypothetical protein